MSEKTLKYNTRPFTFCIADNKRKRKADGFDSILVPLQMVELQSPTRPATKPLLNFTTCNKYTPTLQAEREKSLIDITALRRKKGGVFPIPLVSVIFSMILLVCLMHVRSYANIPWSLQLKA